MPSLQSYYLVQKAIIETRKISALIRKDKYDKIAADLQDALVREWDAKTKEAIRDVIRAVNNRSKFTKAQLGAMVADLKTMMGTAFTQAVGKDLLEINLSTYSVGMQEILGFKPSFNLTDRKAIAALERYALYPVQHFFDDHLEKKIHEFGNKIIKSGLNREEAGKLFEDEFAKQYQIASFRYWQGYADHVVTRSREFGRTSAYEVAEIEYAEVRAILDHRTTEICRHMHGRRIKVSELVRVRDTMIANDDPSKVAEITPWAKPDQIAKTKTENLPDGALMPPYHFKCRTRTIMAREISEVNTVDGTKMGKDVSKDDRQKLNSLDKDEYGNWMQTIRGKRTMNFTPNELDKHLAEHGGKLGATDKDSYLKAGRGIIRNSTNVMAKVNNTADGKALLEFHFFSDKGKVVVGDDLLFHSIVSLDDSSKSWAGSLSGGLWLKGVGTTGK